MAILVAYLTLHPGNAPVSVSVYFMGGYTVT